MEIGVTKAVIFDMDGLLIDSEPLWRKAEIEAFAQVGLHLTDADCRETMGYRLDEVVALWYARQPWQGPALIEVEAEILRLVRELILSEGRALPGVYKAVDLCATANLRIALASSSPMSLIEAVVERLDLGDAFEVIRSAEDEDYGKPHPAVFLSTAGALDAAPEDCVVFEDSIHGMIAALAAKMRVIAVPEPGLKGHPALGAAHLVLESLDDLEVEMLRG